MASLNSAFLEPAELAALGFAELGHDVLVHRSAVLVDCGRIVLGSHVRIDPFTVISASGQVEIGSHVHIAAGCSLAGSASIRIGDFAGLSHGTRVLSASDHFNGTHLTGPTVPPSLRSILSAPVEIGPHAILGAGVVVLPGVTIGDGCAVGALSLVRTSLAPWGIYAGIPARRLRDRDRGLLDLETSLRDLEEAQGERLRCSRAGSGAARPKKEPRRAKASGDATLRTSRSSGRSRK